MIRLSATPVLIIILLLCAVGTIFLSARLAQDISVASMSPASSIVSTLPHVLNPATTLFPISPPPPPSAITSVQPAPSHGFTISRNHPRPSPIPSPTGLSSIDGASVPHFLGDVTVSPNPMRNHQSVVITVHASPAVHCTVDVVYAGYHHDGSPALRTTKSPDAGGVLSWSWKPETTYLGKASVAVECQTSTQGETVAHLFTVQ